MPRLFKTVVERRHLTVNVASVILVSYKDVRSYVVVAKNEEEARKMTPVCRDEFVRLVQAQVKSPYVYLLPEGA